MVAFGSSAATGQLRGGAPPAPHLHGVKHAIVSELGEGVPTTTSPSPASASALSSSAIGRSSLLRVLHQSSQRRSCVARASSPVAEPPEEPSTGAAPLQPSRQALQGGRDPRLQRVSSVGESRVTTAIRGCSLTREGETRRLRVREHRHARELDPGSRGDAELTREVGTIGPRGHRAPSLSTCSRPNALVRRRSIRSSTKIVVGTPKIRSSPPRRRGDYRVESTPAVSSSVAFG